MPEKEPTAYDAVPYTSWPYPQSHPDRLLSALAYGAVLEPPVGDVTEPVFPV